MEQKHWRIIKIIDDYTIVINGGTNDGLTTNCQLEIITQGESIVDPKTGEELGNLDIPKAKIYVSQVFEKFSVCKSAEEISKSALSTVASSAAANMFRSVMKPLNIDSSEITGSVFKSSKIIRIGDLVRKSL